MCGIAGFIGRLSVAEGRARLEALAGTLAHRGPDARGFFQAMFDHGERQIGLAHRRLSIIDLATGDQPMQSDSGRTQLVFNGEIYNYKALRSALEAKGLTFRTTSDTETVIRAYEIYGVDCLSHFRGMFAFAIWDGDRKQLFVARDRYGEKPLFFAHLDEHFVFASEMKAFLAWPGFVPRLDHETLPLFLQYRYAPGPATLLGQIRKLMPGCYGIWRDGHYVEHRYYRPPDAQAASAMAREDDASERFLAKLDESVELMMASDVPYGAFLSGGIDSSAIVALMATHSGKAVKTFSVGFDEAGYSELAYAGQVAQHFGTDHHELSISGRDVAEWLPEAAYLRDNPVAEPADIPMLLLAREAHRSVKMVLTGEGSDESLGGYPKHVFERRVGAYQRIPRAIRRWVVEPVVDALPYSSRRVRTAALSMGEERFTERMPRWFGALSAAEVEQLLGDAPCLNGARYPFESDPHNSALRRILYFDQTSWLPDNLLERGDRMTMAASIESRMPFMDHELIEFASSLSDSMRVGHGTSKRVLRMAMKQVLPVDILERPKVGFAMPVHIWLREGLKDLLQQQLLTGDSISARLFDRSILERFVREHLTSRRNHEKTLWMLLNFELWARRFDVQI